MATADPRTSIIIVNWNGREDTLACLASLAPVASPNVTVIVVDNGSQDGSVAEIRSRYPGVTVLAQETNLRFAGGNNEGIRHALASGADQILLLNNDTTVDAGFLRSMTACLRSAPDVGAVAPHIYYYDRPDLLWYAGGEISMWTGTMRHAGIREKNAGDGHPYETAYATGCCLLARREVLEHVGLLDESFFIYAEDADWCARARNAGWRIMVDPGARIWHKVSVSAGGHLSWFKLKNKFLSNFRFFARHSSWYHWLTFPWMNILVNAAAAVRYLLAGR
jgi:GT2 family glycosyltransferase